MTPSELRAAMSALPSPPSDVKPPFWGAWQYDLWKRVTDGENPAEFWRWPCVYFPLLNNHWLNFMKHELDELRETGNFIFSKEITPPVNGVFDYIPETPYSATLTHQLYHIHQWEKTTGKRIDKLSTIVEFGAGYGALCLLAYRLGFKGTYHIVDLPEFSLLQQYYLSNTGEMSGKHVNILWSRNTENIPLNDTPDLLIALYSLSEVPFVLRDKTIDDIGAKSHLFLYSNRFADYDNVTYFDGYAKRAGGNWKTWKIEHMPPESWYSIGWS